MMKRFACIVLCVFNATLAFAGGSSRLSLAGAGEPGAFALFEYGVAAPLRAAGDDWPGVLRAAGDLQSDIERVTGVKPELATGGGAASPSVVLIGTVGRSALIDGLVASGKLDVTDIRDRWEAFQIATVDDPLPGVSRALVIAGSDKRGTIYGIFEISRLIGVSPWYWWADVPVARRDTIHIASGAYVDLGPTVRYRGIFLNDEAPALTGWVGEKFGSFNHEFYGHVFELLLRLRANYIWPAMWIPRAFADDDPENARLADEYGIVVGTSHHEPMMRAHDEWNRFGRGPWDYSKNDEVLREFWRGGYERSKNYETLTTLGMRGDGDEAMSEETNTALLERIVADQRKIIADISGKPPEEVPQVWALYKEVQGYYERGMRVPDDVTLLWCDDNWGNIRRLPTPTERARSGGAGVYYHFDYVGGPRNYKWMNVTPITKVWEQMHLAWQLDANRIWIVNVGDLKPMEFPIEFFLTYAWDPAGLPYEKLGEFTRGWAAREFGEQHAAGIAALIDGYTKLNRHRTPEMMSPDTYSLTNYDEAGRILAQWRDLVARAESVSAALPEPARAAFFQLVLYPVKASATVREVHIAAAKNSLYAEQGRANSANAAADHARAMFARDAALKDEYHTLLDGKWNHTMAETKFGYTYWQTPPVEVMPALSIARPAKGPAAGLAVDGSRFAYPRWGMPPPRTPAIDVYGRSSTWVELFSRGDAPLDFKVTPSVPWLRVSPTTGTISEDIRLNIEADWENVPLDVQSAEFVVDVSSPSDATGFSQRYTVTVPVVNPSVLRPGGFAGHVETNGVVSIEAPHYSRIVEESGITWKVLPDHGRTLGGMTAFPVTAGDRQPGGRSSRVEYDFYAFTRGELKVDMHFAPSLDFHSGEGLRFAVSVDDAEPQIVKLDTWKTNQTWEQSVGENVRRVMTTHAPVEPGRHVLKFWLVTPGVVLQKIVIEPQVSERRWTGGVRPSYLGPPESPRLTGPASPWTMSQAEQDRVWSLNEADHDEMMRQLGITKLRPGRDGSGKPGAPNAANYDESKANPFPGWPELLTTKSGAKVATADAWWNARRPEIVEDFEREVVGRIPDGVPGVEWKVAREMQTNVGGLPAIARQVIGTVDNSAHPEISVDIRMSLVLPTGAKGPVPVLIMFGSGGLPGEPRFRFPGYQEPVPPPSEEQLIAAGWGYVSLSTSSIQADNGAGLTSGIIGLVNKGRPRTPEQWGALRAWGWGASRALDFLETVPEVDAKRVGIEGVSRYGKAALVTMAFDPRFAVALIGSSGEGGVKPHRRNFGEAVENLTGTYSYHWMAGNFIKYGADESRFGRKDAGDIPVDSHQLLALCAPRPVFVSYGIPEKGDALWLDQQGSFMATVAAGEAWRLLGAKDLGVEENYRAAKLPPVNQGLLDGELAWRQHDGGHEDRTNMSFFLGWANKLFKHWPPHRPADQPVMRLDRNSHLAHAALLQKAKHGPEGVVDVYFQGDSIFRRWGATDYPQYLEHFNNCFHGWNAADFAWGADQTQHMLWRMDNGELDGLKPRVFVLLAGTNNVGGNPPDDATVVDVSRGIAAIVGRFRRHAPAARVIVMGILPRGDDPAVISGIGRINANIAQLADGEHVFFVDVTDRFTDSSGKLIEALTMDKLHPNLKGYEIMGDSLKPLLTEILGPPAAADHGPPPTGDPSAGR